MRRLNELSTSGALGWERGRAADAAAGGFGVLPARNRKPEYVGKRGVQGLPDAPGDWPYSTYPYGQLQKNPGANPSPLPVSGGNVKRRPDELPGRAPLPADWKDGVAVYRDRGRVPGRMWTPTVGGVGPGDSDKPKEFIPREVPPPRAFWRRPYDVAVDGPHRPNMKMEPRRAMFMSKEAPAARELLAGLEEFVRGEGRV